MFSKSIGWFSADYPVLIPQKMRVFITTAVRTSNRTLYEMDLEASKCHGTAGAYDTYARQRWPEADATSKGSKDCSTVRMLMYWR
jgi:hypothetical protein